MSLAEQKRALLRAVEEADEETTAKLISFMQKLKQEGSFSQEDITEFHRRREEFMKNPESGIAWEEAMERMRKKLSK